MPIGFYIAIGALAVIFIAYLFLIAPRMIKRKFKLPEGGYAHRGLWNEERPENSMSAFAAAVDAGYGIETDVRLTKDGVPVLFHDDTLKRVCGDDRRVIDLTYEELGSMRLSGSDEGIPTLAQLIELAGNKIPLLIELKGEDLNTDLCHVIAPMLEGLGDMVCVESFNPVLLNKMKKLMPKMPRGQLVTALVAQHHPGNPLKNGALSAMLLNFLSRPDFIAYNKDFPHGAGIFFCTRIFRAGRCTWTVKDKEEQEKFLKKGITPIFEHKD